MKEEKVTMCEHLREADMLALCLCVCVYLQPWLLKHRLDPNVFEKNLKNRNN